MNWQVVLKSPRHPDWKKKMYKYRQRILDEGMYSTQKGNLNYYVVKDSIWKEAFGTLGANDVEISTGVFPATFKEIEKALNRKLTPHDFSFYAMNFEGDTERHLGLSNYKLLLQLFTDKDYQIKSYEGFENENHDVALNLAREELQKELERLQ